MLNADMWASDKVGTSRRLADPEWRHAEVRRLVWLQLQLTDTLES